MVARLKMSLGWGGTEALVAMRSKISLTNGFKMSGSGPATWWGIPSTDEFRMAVFGVLAWTGALGAAWSKISLANELEVSG